MKKTCCSGADIVIDYKHEGFATVLTDHDVVLDLLGGQTLAKSPPVLKPGGLAIAKSCWCAVTICGYLSP